ncbi:MAG: aminotransferase class I/II-fold pyridoxal phosphate-dependent enzyme [Synergistes sp.]|nr:aminotransferase class I/II-fold pyridoxal phosphate-dependent enzyme [Synergistes sp.]
MQKFNKKIWLASPYIHEEEREYVKKAFDTNWMSTVGENIDELEKRICEYLGCGAAAALSSGTAALHLAVKLAGVGAGDIVLCSDMTFSATVNPVSYEGGTQVFIDSERETWNMSPDALERGFKKYGGNVKAVIAADLYGTPAKLDEIAAICEKHSVPLIEDAAESLGAVYEEKKSGTFGRLNVISFNGNKIITGTSGGMLLSDDEALIAKAKFLSTQARDPAPWYQHSEIGYNYRMSNLIAGVARGQMYHIDEHCAMKKEIRRRYEEGLKDFPVTINPIPENAEANCWLTCITINEEAFGEGSGKATPEKIRKTLELCNAESRPIWKPMHMQPVFAKNDFITADGLPVDEDIFARGLCLPSDLNMTVEEQERIIEIIKECFRNVGD